MLEEQAELSRKRGDLSLPFPPKGENILAQIYLLRDYGPWFLVSKSNEQYPMRSAFDTVLKRIEDITMWFCSPLTELGHIIEAHVNNTKEMCLLSKSLTLLSYPDP